MNNQRWSLSGMRAANSFWSFQETSQAVDQAGRQERGRRQELKGGR